jgi:membrane protease YdiL (CAAX protease family)
MEEKLVRRIQRLKANYYFLIVVSLVFTYMFFLMQGTIQYYYSLVALVYAYLERKTLKILLYASLLEIEIEKNKQNEKDINNR